MNIRAKQTKITAKHRSRYIYLDGVILYHKINGLPHLLKRENHAYSLNPLTPVDILEIKWSKWNENDEIVKRTCLLIFQNL
jgi:hypothetical protein